MEMTRLWYIGEGVFVGHPRMGGVRLPKGQAVDVAGDLVAELLASGQFVDHEPGQEDLLEITNQTPKGLTEFQELAGVVRPYGVHLGEPKSLTEIAGIGDATAAVLDEWGVKTVEDLAGLSEEQVHAIAGATPGISKSLLRRWRDVATE